MGKNFYCPDAPNNARLVGSGSPVYESSSAATERKPSTRRTCKLHVSFTCGKKNDKSNNGCARNTASANMTRSVSVEGGGGKQETAAVMNSASSSSLAGSRRSRLWRKVKGM